MSLGNHYEVPEFGDFDANLTSVFDDDVKYEDLHIESTFTGAVNDALHKTGVTNLNHLLSHHRVMMDALDHIKRICNGARQPTKRMDWVVQRCKMALRGEVLKDYDPMPKMSRDHELEDMRIALINSQKLLREHLPEVAESQIKLNSEVLNECPGINPGIQNKHALKPRM